MTIIYALIGIPLMFLYLSNIGDYLADIFRVIYSRTCRTSCERFCSASIFNNHNNNNKQIEQMNKFINNNNLQQNEPVDNDPIVNPTHSHGRRRKRILLPPFNTKINDYDTSMNHNNNNNNNYNHIINKVNCTNKKTKNDSVNLNEIDNKTNVTMEATTSKSNFNNKKIELFHYLKNKQFFIKFLKHSQKSYAFIKKSCMLPFDRSNNTIALTQFDDSRSVYPIHFHRLFLISSSAESWNAALALPILAFTSASEPPCSSMMLPSILPILAFTSASDPIVHR
ncbi:unnamed protein product [Schistosoma mattheei]|uniref:Uncharacterized protein n=1 Tax=Schistosoma mattheei TaxID=31246 RepID=A0A183PWU0_9TREM|nr:unnamed protein product [Schistosoma mattheei]